ncbi:DUF4760 domain-containing protein [Halomonas sp. SL1]|uniref:DUF4760 domain-containing protein n=1 Tax=Halomonas sp. SL1 TaxID=2137478 RepID=UPI0015EB3A96|nr:DUF4760 domain-containing protein [Halomonas sp. SL1]
MINQEPLILVSQNGHWWVSPLAILLSAVVGAGTALFAVWRQRHIARVRATLDVILKSESDEFYKEIHRCFSSELKRNGGLEGLINAQSEAEIESRTSVLDFLNHYELIAVSIDRSILDEHFYKSWMRSTYIRHFDESFAFIDKIRKEKEAPKFCEYFERLAVKWKIEGAPKVNHNHGFITKFRGWKNGKRSSNPAENDQI